MSKKNEKEEQKEIQEIQQPKKNELVVQSFHATTHKCTLNGNYYEIKMPLLPLEELILFLGALKDHVQSTIDKHQRS